MATIGAQLAVGEAGKHLPALMSGVPIAIGIILLLVAIALISTDDHKTSGFVTLLIGGALVAGGGWMVYKSERPH